MSVNDLLKEERGQMWAESLTVLNVLEALRDRADKKGLPTAGLDFALDMQRRVHRHLMEMLEEAAVPA
jgi:hypothetical protein